MPDPAASISVESAASPHATAPRPVAPGTIVAERLAQLVERARAMPELDATFVRAVEDVAALAGGIEPYAAACSTPQSEALAELERATAAEDWAARHAGGETALELEREMVSGHVEGRVLNFLIGATRATRVLEIGCFTGYSALAMAEALPANGTLVACEVDPYAAAFAERAVARSPHGRKIRIVVGPALDTLHRLADDGAAFDVIFIDADKANYFAYLDLALERGLLAPGGFACVDNTLMQGRPWLPGPATPNGAAIADFNRRVRDDPRVEQVVLAIRDGLTLIRRA